MQVLEAGLLFLPMENLAKDLWKGTCPAKVSSLAREALGFFTHRTARLHLHCPALSVWWFGSAAIENECRVFFSTELSGIEGPGGKAFFHMPKDGWFREDQVSEGA